MWWSPFHIHKRLGAAGVLTQLLGSWHHPVAYLSKQFDTVSQSRLPCLRTLAATAILEAEADKFILGQELTVWVPHSVLNVMEYKENYCLTNFQMVKYQSISHENPHVWLEVIKNVNPDTLLFRPNRAWLFRDYGWGFLQLARLYQPVHQSSRSWVFYRW
jgi:hypothetical protein